MGDQEFVQEVYHGSYRRLVAQLYAMCGDLVEAEDAVQEAFVRAIAAGGKFRRVDNPEAWLRTVAINVQRNRWRKLRNFQAIRHRVEHPTDVPGLSEDHLAVVSGLQSLPMQQREALALHYLADLSVAQISRTLGVAEGTVKARLSRGRAALARVLDEQEGGVDHV